MKNIGDLNRNGQQVVKKTSSKGTSGRAYAWWLRCTHCGCEYLANSTEAFQRKCPQCQKGRPGIAEDRLESPKNEGTTSQAADR